MADRGQWVLPGARTLFAFLGFSALVTEVATLVAQDRYDSGDFFSYFTVEANTLAVVSLMLGAFASATGWNSRRFECFRGLVTLAMTTVILIFIVLLSDYSSAELTAVPWDNTVLHYIMPIAVLADWLLTPRPTRFPYRTALVWLALPLAYLAYSLIRGPIVDWYPYPFMDPSHHGYVGVALTSIVIAVILAVLTWVIAALSGRLSAVVSTLSR